MIYPGQKSLEKITVATNVCLEHTEIKKISFAILSKNSISENREKMDVVRRPAFQYEDQFIFE